MTFILSIGYEIPELLSKTVDPLFHKTNIIKEVIPLVRPSCYELAVLSTEPSIQHKGFVCINSCYSWTLWKCHEHKCYISSLTH